MQLAIGVISGTSMDGIDIAAIRTNGTSDIQRIAGTTYPYQPELRDQISTLLGNPERARLDPLESLEQAVARSHSNAVLAFLSEHAISANDVHVVGLHGQTVLHRPDIGFTRQLCDLEYAAKLLGIDVVGDFRQADVNAGGQGAPLAPLYHQAITGDQPLPVIVLNWGGVGNITYIDENTVLAFDCGPASAIIDDFVMRRTGNPFDRNGTLALAGIVDARLVSRLMQNEFFRTPPPKSLDRNHFHDLITIPENNSTADGTATLTQFTIEATAAALAHCPQTPKTWIVCGGGRLNRALMEGLQKSTKIPVQPIENIGFDGDFIEAECFAWLAMRSLAGLPLSLPTTTGVPKPLTGGTLVRHRR
ncbi:MAG: anhydro-N-acetylmuramic acid kinase [Hyphomicrobiales bacterium]|nr:MAG: anhydro-N-acetylmuramic acid kinase [Hyphomicrobiales bacterium]